MAGVSEALSETIRCLDDGTVSGSWSEKLDAAVDGVKSGEERRLEYMVMIARDMEIRVEGRNEARREAAERIAKEPPYLSVALFEGGGSGDSRRRKESKS